jgi:hypothetical protein
MEWGRLFGLFLDGFFTGTPFEVETEIDLSKRMQLLDVLVIRRLPGEMPRPLPDGMHDLVEHNLITFKSHKQTFDSWTLNELLGDYVNYRKQVSPSFNDLLPEEQFRLFGITARFPRDLAADFPFRTISPGVFEVRWGSELVRILVLRDLPACEANAVLSLFTADREQVLLAQEQYRQHDPESSTMIQELLNRYREEGLPVGSKLQEFIKESKRKLKEELLTTLTPEEKRALAQELPVEEKRALAQELPTEELLKGRSLAEIEAYLEKLRNSGNETS